MPHLDHPQRQNLVLDPTDHPTIPLPHPKTIRVPGQLLAHQPSRIHGQSCDSLHDRLALHLHGDAFDLLGPRAQNTNAISRHAISMSLRNRRTPCPLTTTLLTFPLKPPQRPRTKTPYLPTNLTKGITLSVFDW